jgi:hypothetical protein
MRKSPRIHAFFAVFFLAAFFYSFPLEALEADGIIPELSDQARISLITMGEGKEIYIAFGHNALRVRDPKNKLDLLFNYGSFDFEDPLFIPKFVYGDLKYYLSFHRFGPYLEYDIEYQNRTWAEQVFDLDAGQANRLFAFLMDNAREENRFYRYDFIKDNCATRIPDALIKALDGEILFAETAPGAEGKSYRRMSNEYLSNRPFFAFLFYLVLGTKADKKVTAFESSFLPHYLHEYLEGATILRNGEWVPLVASSSILYEPAAPPAYGSPWFNPSYFLWPLAFLVFVLSFRKILPPIRAMIRCDGRIAVKRSRFGNIADFLLFFTTGFFGCLLLYLDFFSVHTATKGNLNILWMWPTHLIFSVFFFRKKGIKFLGWYFLASSALCLIPILCWPFWPQQMHPTMIPLMLIMSLRAAAYFFASTGSVIIEKSVSEDTDAGGNSFPEYYI